MQRKIIPSYFRLFKHIIACLLFYLPLTYFHGNALAQDLIFPEYSIKAAFIFNFGKYVDWPADSTPGVSNDTLRICILGEDPFGADLESMQGKSVKFRKIEIKNIKAVDDGDGIKNCHILFISRSEKNALPQIIKQLEKYPVLTITDLNDMPDSGAMINLITVDDKVRFEINLNSARKAGIDISSQLLKLATRVTE